MTWDAYSSFGWTKVLYAIWFYRPWCCCYGRSLTFGCRRTVVVDVGVSSSIWFYRPPRPHSELQTTCPKTARPTLNSPLDSSPQIHKTTRPTFIRRLASDLYENWPLTQGLGCRVLPRAQLLHDDWTDRSGLKNLSNINSNIAQQTRLRE